MKIVNAPIKVESDGTASKTTVTLKSDSETFVIDYDAKNPDEDKLAAALMKAFGKLGDGQEKKQAALRVGSSVRVRDTGKQYKYYSEWAINNLKQSQLIAFGIGVGREWKDKKGTVVAIAPHSSTDKKTLVAVEVRDIDKHDTAIGIFSADGLEVLG